MPALTLILIALWFIFGSPKNDIANIFWPESLAPWEEVEAFYYPNRGDLSEVKSSGVDGIEGCRAWVNWQAQLHNDPHMDRGDYECGIGFIEMFGSIKVYRITIR